MSSIHPKGLGPQQLLPLYRADSQTPATIQANLTSNQSTMMQGNSNLIAHYANHFISVFSSLGVGPQQQPPLYRAASQNTSTIQAHLTPNHSTLMQGK